MVKALAAQRQTTLAAVREFDQQIEALCRAHEDCQLFASLPGAGRVYASRLLTAMGSNRERWQSADERLCFSSIAPVVERSGKSLWTRWRYFCPKFIRQSFVEYAGESIRHSEWAQAFYGSQKAKGKSHQAAVCARAYKWIRIIFRCWQTRTKYDEARYVECLRKQGSKLVGEVASVAA
ncbi:MAG: transposase [Pyrinomonadaceae bacterium]|nr:transposase [Pyrinomonadaceae bacterium]